MKSAKDLSWAGWTNTEKPVDRERPFHRINSPTMAQGKLPASGRGYDCGCRVEDDIGPAGLLELLLVFVKPIFGKDLRKLIRTVPAWVPVKVPKDGVDPAKPAHQLTPAELRIENEPQELEGILVRSFQTWTDFPLFQWHRWYDWNFMVVPAPFCDYLRGAANVPPNVPSDKRAAIRDFDKRDVGTMECEFDCGMFGSRFRDQQSPKSFGPMFEADWAWPMAGQLLWARGQWIYDCGHPSNNNKTGPDAGVTRTELHPCSAVAAARWEAVQFSENGKFKVPAIQFMFFATTLGGYTDDERRQLTAFPKEDIEFIVDLPKQEFHAGPFPVGHTPQIAHNTIEMPQLLQDVDFEPFKTSIDKTASPKSFKTSKIPPIVTPIRRKDDPGAPPQQVHVRIPFKSEIPPSDDYYGFILSLGWSDPTLALARRVKKVKVTFERVLVGRDDQDAFLSGSGEWQIRACVNGRWIQKRKEGVTKRSNIPLGQTFEFFLADEDDIAVAAHGEETDLVHDVYRDRNDAGRVLFVFGPRVPILGPPFGLSGVPVIGPLLNLASRKMLYFQDCVPPTSGGQGDLGMAREVVSSIIGELATTFEVQSDPLGRIDPGHVTKPVTDTENPLLVSKVTKVGGTVKGIQTAVPTSEFGDSAELVEDPTGLDYALFYTIETEPQIKDS